MQETHSFGEWLRRRRRALDLTQKALAEATSCSEDAIRKIESDERRPSRRLAERLAARLGVADADRAGFLEAARALRSVDRLPQASGAGPDGNARVSEPNPPAVPLDRQARIHPPVVSAAATFVGRKREMDELVVELGTVVAGNGRLAMLAGEPGIGKTRTATELGILALQHDCRVLWGRCYEGSGAPPFWPWVQAIRSYVEQCGTEKLQSELASGAGEIAEIVPEIRERVPHAPVPSPLDPEQARFRLFDAIVRFMRNASHTQPIVLILEDLHWADQASLRLLEFLASELTGMRLFVIGTYRDVEVSRRHPLAHTLAELTRHGLARRLALRGLSREDVEEFIQSMGPGAQPTTTLVDAVYRQTEGNPLFVTEVVRLLREERGTGAQAGAADAGLRIPEGVREVIGRRLDRLSSDCNDCLTSAAVLGRQFTLEQLTRLMSNLAPAQVLDALEQALAARIIEELPRIADEYQFTHALIAETLVAELSTTRRIRMHARVGNMLEQFHGEEATQHAAELAHHFAEAVTVTGNAKLIQYSVLAGDQALAAHAHEQALAHYERALSAREGEAMDAQLAEILVRRSRAAMIGLERHRFVELIGSVQKAFDYFVAVGDVAKAVEIADSSFPHFIGVEGTMTALIDRALDLAAPDSLSAARLLTRKARILGVSVGDDVGAQAALRRAVEIARRENDLVIERRALLSGAYVAFFNLRQADGVKLGLATIELADLADARDDAVAARYFVTSCLRNLADAERMRHHADALQHAGAKVRNRYWITGADWLSETAARMQGNWSQARSFSDHGLALSPNDIRLLSTRVFLELEEGDKVAGDVFLNRLEASVRMTPPGATPEYAMACGVLAISVDISGDIARLETAEEFALAVLSAKTPALGVGFIAKLTLLLSALHKGGLQTNGFGDAESYWQELRAARHPLCLPGTHCYDRFLGRFARALGKVDEAVLYFEEAIALCRRIDYQAELAWSLFDYAAFLKGRARRGDHAVVVTHLNESLEIANRLGMKPLAARIRRSAGD